MEIASSLVSCIVIAVLVILCWKGKFWGAVLFSLFPFGFVFSGIIGLLLAYTIPGESIQKGPNLPYLPFLVSALLLLVAVLSVVIGQKTNIVRKEKSSFMRWIIFFIVYFSLSFPITCSMILIYAVPYSPKTSFTFLASLCTLGYIPYALLLIGMTREYVKKETPADA